MITYYQDPKSLDFRQACQEARSLDSTPADEDLLKLYSLYKQATIGDNNTPRPWIVDFRGRAKWDAWTEQCGKNKDSAKVEYTEFVQLLKQKLGYTLVDIE